MLYTGNNLESRLSVHKIVRRGWGGGGWGGWGTLSQNFSATDTFLKTFGGQSPIIGPDMQTFQFGIKHDEFFLITKFCFDKLLPQTVMFPSRKEH